MYRHVLPDGTMGVPYDVTSDVKNTTNREFIIPHYVTNQDNVCETAQSDKYASRLLVLLRTVF
jgi:hypothetical protein